VIALIEQRKASIADLCRQHEVRGWIVWLGRRARLSTRPQRPGFYRAISAHSYAGYADAFLDFADALEQLLGARWTCSPSG